MAERLASREAFLHLRLALSFELSPGMRHDVVSVGAEQKHIEYVAVS